MDTSELQRIKQRYGIVGNDEGLNRALEIALKIAPVDLSVLITGENGVGKEIFPRVIHDHSLRKGKKYLAVNCGAIPEGTIDSELFGHEKGAFTGAVERREGYFAVAGGGTLFLDEVGELPLSTQSRLLRVLETGEFIPVGASEVRRTDVRIVAATNVNMEKAIADGKFREDLYYRLNSVSISVPPLRRRGDDVVLLFRKFALEMSEKYKMPPVRLDESAQKMLVAYAWPGNVRQLKNVAENMSVTSEVRAITSDILQRYLPEERRHNQVVAVAPASGKHSFENEREILYQILFDLRRDVSELKKIIRENNLASHPASHAPAGANGLPLFGADGSRFGADSYEAPIFEAEEIKESETAELPPAGVSLEEVERQSILAALTRNGGNRRLAAGQLGISERTLYRKIKEYGLE
ncbi:DNA-binding transcriptional regulator NtrC [Bacteroidaceae bacterium]|jgi:transcriptional regulator with PAS, ATPase and Fis domain|uniref:sigma-54 interaction domain-containing protein n=1 Tax=Prevotella sp. MGM2 TaxID=2033406 RepID=UPI000CEA6BFD|nr:sigma-54 dependent transcriptional regulator [Prevotella sp. MGM2]GAY29538.1 sigma-54-dependent Fis family transcriptional regulator [Prevotella sp. MGM2]GFI35151.1 DNA-binding transcriptional regulator NtrC [Bacteroidaceae bacterium]